MFVAHAAPSGTSLTLRNKLGFKRDILQRTTQWTSPIARNGLAGQGYRAFAQGEANAHL